jgi:cell division transport system permease protein
MALPNNFFAPSFRTQRLGSFFALLVGIMVFLATFSSVAEVIISAATLNWNQHAENRLTIELPAVGDEATTPQPERIKQTMGLLHAMPGVQNITQLSDHEVEDLLRPWINQPELLKSLPLPTLIDVQRSDNSMVTAEDIRQQIKIIAPDVRVDDHAAWLGDLKHFVHSLVFLAGLMIVLTGCTLAITVNLLCRAIMAAEYETISLLHILGAEDASIAKHFAHHAGRLSIPPACIGFGLGITVAGTLILFVRHLADLSGLSSLLWIVLTAIICLVPVSAVVLTRVTARLSTFSTLDAMP